MCGIFAQIGKNHDAPAHTLEGLKRLEYRGYDSWGVAWLPADGTKSSSVLIQKKVGKIGEATLDAESHIALGHTRWATHGGVTQTNAHPHLSAHGSVAVVHNGIIENYVSLRNNLQAQGVELISETDTEVFAHSVEKVLDKVSQRGVPTVLDVRNAVTTVFNQVTGLNACVVLHPATESIVAVRHGSPLCVGRGENGFYIASDSTALAQHADEVVYLPDESGVVCTKDSITFFHTATGENLEVTWEPLVIQQEQVALGEFPHFLIKEIHESPRVVRALADAAGDCIPPYAAWMGSGRQAFVGCGTAYHAGLVGRAFFAELVWQVPEVFPGSEFDLVRNILEADTKVSFLSQSGETIDIVEHIAPLQARNVEFGAMVNRLGSTLERLSTHKILLGAGPEQSVLATKSFMAKVAVLYLLAMDRSGDFAGGVSRLKELEQALRLVVNSEYREKNLMALAKELKKHDHMFVIGRGVGHPLALEAALKIKEVTYIHAEGFAGGELKHGVIALIEEGTPCIVLMPGKNEQLEHLQLRGQDQTQALLSHTLELKSRGAWTIGIGPETNEAFDTFLPVSDLGLLTGIGASAVIQQLAYLLAVELGNDPDKPRNLAKSVTVR